MVLHALFDDAGRPPGSAVACNPDRPVLGHPTSYHFRRKDRQVAYPISDRRDPAIGMLYQGSGL